MHIICVIYVSKLGGSQDAPVLHASVYNMLCDVSLLFLFSLQVATSLV